MHEAEYPALERLLDQNPGHESLAWKCGEFDEKLSAFEDEILDV
jgi:hypothetical protein